MAHFEELQQLWQQQAETPVTPREAESLAAGFRKFGRRQDLINGGKALLLVFQVVYIFLTLRHDTMRMVGAGIVDLCVVYFLVKEWRNQRSVARLNFAASSVDFLRGTIARLQALRNPFAGRDYVILMSGFWVGCNLMMRGPHWIGRILLTIAPFAFYHPSVYLRGKRWDHECRPLVTRLTELIEAAEENRTWTVR
jgi:hypothetical protein